MVVMIMVVVVKEEEDLKENINFHFTSYTFLNNH